MHSDFSLKRPQIETLLFSMDTGSTFFSPLVPKSGSFLIHDARFYLFGEILYTIRLYSTGFFVAVEGEGLQKLDASLQIIK